MALKDIFTMIKADRYTADGCEEIKKAQESIKEETADAGLPDGSMSHRKDGDYIKQAGKWVPAKRANGGAKKSDKPNPNGVVAQQKQKMEAEKHEAARRDAQAPSKKTEVNTPGLRKDVQEAIKRSSPEEIKAYIKELRTPGSRMSRYFDNPDLLANVYEDELKKATESKSAEETKTGVPIQGSNWMSLPSGTRMTFEGAKEKMAQNSQRIEALKKSMEGKSFADNFRAGIELKKLENENEYIAERLPREMRASESKSQKAMEAANKPAAGTGSAPKFETEQENAKYEEGLKGWDNVDPARLPDIKTKVEQKIDYYKKYDPYAMLGKKTGLSAAQKESVKQNMAQAKENLAFYTGQLEGINKKMSTDAAPRQLTGDCKIRIRKSK